ncbi:MAG: hypothetical protein ABI408_00175 [Gemmatimonadaceae bacterium]
MARAKNVEAQGWQQARPPMPNRLRGFLTASVALIVACHSYTPVASDVNMREEVRVQFAAPRDVVGKKSSGVDVTLPAIREFSGVVLSVGGDSLVVAASAAVGEGGAKVPIEPGTTITVVRGPAVSIYAKRFDESKTALVGIGGGAVVLYVLLLAAIVSVLALY